MLIRVTAVLAVLLAASGAGCSRKPAPVLQAPPAPVRDYDRDRRIAEAEGLLQQAGQVMALCQANDLATLNPEAWESLSAAYDSAVVLRPREQPDALARQSQFVIDEGNSALAPLRDAAERALVRAQDAIADLAAEAGEEDDFLLQVREELAEAMRNAQVEARYAVVTARYDEIARKAAEGSGEALKARATAMLKEIEANLESARFNGFRERRATQWEAVRDGKDLLLAPLAEGRYRHVITQAAPLVEQSRRLQD